MQQYQFVQGAPLCPLQTSLEPVPGKGHILNPEALGAHGKWGTTYRYFTWLRTSESDADDTNVIASPLVPNRPARPTFSSSKFSKGDQLHNRVK